MQIITTRLVIRPFEPSDLPQFEKLLDIPEVPGWQMQKSRSAAFLAWHISNYQTMDIIHGIVCFGIFAKATGEVLGAIGAGEHDDLHETEIFYNLLPSARGHGYATEAAQAVTEWAVNCFDISSIIGTVSVNNIPSQRVLERCGYQFVCGQNLLVHIAGQREQFRIYRYSPNR